jgi:hypothetical protein
MKKVLFFAAAAIAMLASCSQSDDLTAPTVAQNDQQQTAIEFGTYMGKAAQTRSGSTGEILNTTNLKDKGGFSVFAYYTGATDYAGNQTSTAPNFMYNQAVTSTDGTSWTYTPIKYWPNEYAAGNVDDKGAQGAAANGKVSFFAYAPYVTVTSTDIDAAITGKNNNTNVAIAATEAVKTEATTSGIVAVTKNSLAKNPYLQYKLANIKSLAENVDLLWGTSGTLGQTATGTAQTGATLDGGKAAVNVNLNKMKTSGKIGFNFKHALAIVGGKNTATAPATPVGLTIQRECDEPVSTWGASSYTSTKITVESIVITNDVDGDNHLTTAGEGIIQGGVLNLATGEWNTDDPSTADALIFTQTIDGTGTGDNYKLNSLISENGVSFADNAAVTSWFSYATDADGDTKPGVTETKKSVYDASDAASPFVFVPGQTPKLKVTITYKVRTYDTNLANYRSEVTQTISKVITFGNAVELNKRYNVNIILGLTSVKFQATIADWEDGHIDNNGTPTDPSDDTDNIYLPINVTGA